MRPAARDGDIVHIYAVVGNRGALSQGVRSLY